MYEIEHSKASESFLKAWSFAGRDLSAQGQGALNWIRNHLYPPLVDHLSFRIGNQIFCVLIDESGDKDEIYRKREGRLVEFCERHRLVACRYKLRQTPDGSLAKQRTGWNLVSLPHEHVLSPLDLVTDENISMSAWEKHDFGIQIVRRHIEGRNGKVTSFQSMTDLDPSLWFETAGNLHWCVVRTAVYPMLTTPRPGNIDAIAASCRQLSPRGYFASVALASDQDPFAGAERALPLYRGHGVTARFTGLEALTPEAGNLEGGGP